MESRSKPIDKGRVYSPADWSEKSGKSIDLKVMHLGKHIYFLSISVTGMNNALS